MRLSDLREYFELRPILKEPWRFIRTWREPVGEDAIEFKDGPPLRIRGASNDRHLFHTIFARDEYRLKDVAPGSWGTVLDLGAHIGFFARRVAPLAKRVICYEPEPTNYSMLKVNLAHPSLSHVVAHPVAIADKDGPIEFYTSPTDPSAHSLVQGKEGCVTSTRVDAITLARVFRDHAVESCDLLKLDCEGGEYAILPSVPDELWPRIRRIRMEFHSVPDGWSGPKLVDFLTSKGYRCELMPRRSRPDRGLLFAERAS